MKPSGLADFAESAALKCICNSTLWLHALRLASPANSTIAQLGSYYRKWLKYYLDFCFKYHHDKSKKESLSYFIKKLKDKNQTEQQQKQAFQAVSIFYGIKNTDQDEIEALKNKKENISTKNRIKIN